MSAPVVVWLDPPDDAFVDALAAHGSVVVARWDPAAPGDRAGLLTAVREARELAHAEGHDPDGVVLVGTGRGATGAVALAVNARRLGIALAGAVAVDPGDGLDDPVSGAPLPVDLPTSPSPCTVTVLGDGAAAVELDRRLRASGWPGRRVLTDDAGVVGAVLLLGEAHEGPVGPLEL